VHRNPFGDLPDSASPPSKPLIKDDTGWSQTSLPGSTWPAFLGLDISRYRHVLREGRASFAARLSGLIDFRGSRLVE
jgi:hypothetical protein